MKWALRAIAFALLAALVTVRVLDPWPLRTLRNTYFDYLQRLHPRSHTPLPVRIVTIDDASLAKLGQWPWPRSRLADLTNALADLGAAVVVYDFIFSEPDRLSPARMLTLPEVRDALGRGIWTERLSKLDNDGAFAQAMHRVPTVLSLADAGAGGPAPPAAKAGFAAIGNDPIGALFPLRSASPVLPILAKAAAGLGVINVDPNGNSDVIRTVPLLWRSGSNALPSLSLEALRVALQANTIVLNGPNQGPPEIDRVRLGQFTMPVTQSGLVHLNYRRMTAADFIPALAVLNGKDNPALRQAIQGSIVFVGASAAGLSDIRTTVLGQQVPGVTIHAQMVEQMLTGAFLTRNTATQLTEILALTVMAALMLVAMSSFGPRVAFLSGGFAAAAMLGVSWYAFVRMGILFDASLPLAGGFTVFSGLSMFRYAVTDRAWRATRRSFLRYVSPDVLAEIERRGHALALGGEIREITVMFCDVRNFTPLSETMPPQDLVTMLNTLFTALSGEILTHAGTIDKYIGDEVMAFWNAPLQAPDHARQACHAALGMRAALMRLNRERAEQGGRRLEVTIGIDMGLACVGNIGSANRFNYTAIGETVNIAARTQAASRQVGYDILVTEDVVRAAPGLAYLPAGRLMLKGVTEPVAVSIVVGDEALAATAAFGRLAAAHDAMITGYGRGPSNAQLAELRQLAQAAGVDLTTFYDALKARVADFLPTEPAVSDQRATGR